MDAQAGSLGVTLAREEAAAAPRPATRIGFGEFAAVGLQVALVLAVAVVFRIELERGFATIAVLTFGGFLVHAWLPDRWQLPFFVLLTLTAISLLLGGDGIWVVGLGLGILGLCHLPIRWSARVALVLVTAAGLATIRAGWVDAPWSESVLAVLAAMFMFRLILYLYDLKNDRTPATPWQRVAYFFLLPNVSFPLFPIIDYKTFLRTYYDAPAAEIYQKGAYWMLRGVTQLMLYRLVYHLLPRVDSDLPGILGVYAFMAMTYGLYLRVSGLFHLIIGSLCLFGFNLPRANDHYFLASSFNDLWRRINIYWKDFMMTTVFYPVFMRMRSWGLSARLVGATAVVIVVTWFLHSYQWFWLRGFFPIQSTDIVFWGVLGVALAANSVWEAKRGRRRRLGRPSWSWRESLGVTLRTIGLFSFMAALWSLWDGGSFSDWGYRLLRLRESTPLHWGLFFGLVGGAVLVGMGGQWLAARGWGLGRLEGFAFRRAPFLVPAASMAMLLVGLPFVHQRVGGPVAAVVRKAQSTNLNQIDRERQERGYYETLSRATNLASISGDSRKDLPEDWIGFRDSPAARLTSDLRGWEIVPNVVTEFKQVPFHANRWGMRDRDYERAKPPGVYRVALVGSSYSMGSGVGDHETFENVLEDRLNRELGGRGYDRYEILNFSVAGYGLLQELYVAEHLVGDFQPDVVICVVHPFDAQRLIDRLQWVVDRGGAMGGDYGHLVRILEEADGRPGLPAAEFARRLSPYQDALVRWWYSRMVASIRSHGAIPVFVFLSSTGARLPRTEVFEFAEETDAIIIPLRDVYEGYSIERIRIAEWDNHPNRLGHRLIADGLYAEMLRHSDALKLLAPQGVTAGS